MAPGGEWKCGQESGEWEGAGEVDAEGQVQRAPTVSSLLFPVWIESGCYFVSSGCFSESSNTPMYLGRKYSKNK